MRKIFKRTLWGTGIFVIALALVLGSFMFKMNVIETKEIKPNVYAINDSFVDMFLVKDSDNYVAIDVGKDIKVIEDGLKKLSIDPDRVVAVLLTHSDGDHVGALNLFKNAVIYLSNDEEQMINGTTKRMNSYNKIESKTYTLLNDQQNVQIGNLNIKGILTPGHTPGSMCYLFNNKYLFVGDAFSLKDGKIDKPSDFFSMDMKTAIQSLVKISDLPEAQYIFTAHTGYSDNYKKAMKDWKIVKE
ncbi:MAG: MBL fold metallo-hydrolase [Paludibacter sp.]|nr:MBL fold metallo-hydrolase [Paludibacter sp.]